MTTSAMIRQQTHSFLSRDHAEARTANELERCLRRNQQRLFARDSQESLRTATVGSSLPQGAEESLVISFHLCAL